MKFFRLRYPSIGGWSLPVRGAWIEMFGRSRSAPQPLSLPVRGAWIEIPVGADVGIEARGRSPEGERGLESLLAQLISAFLPVAPRKGSVD